MYIYIYTYIYMDIVDAQPEPEVLYHDCAACVYTIIVLEPSGSAQQADDEGRKHQLMGTPRGNLACDAEAFMESRL